MERACLNNKRIRKLVLRRIINIIWKRAERNVRKGITSATRINLRNTAKLTESWS